MSEISKLIINVTKQFNKKSLYIHEPDIIKKDLHNLKNCIDNRNISVTGNFCKLFEDEIKKITGAKYVVLTNSGTSALHLSCILSGINENHEVLIPAFTFVASPNSVIYCGATPHFVEIEKNYFGIDFAKLSEYLKKIAVKKKKDWINKKTRKIIKAIMIVHPLGFTINYDELEKFKKNYNLDIIEDAADALGSYYKGKHAGTFSKLGVLSFNGNKIITTGAGGAILFKNKNLADKARHLIQTSKISHKFKLMHDQLGFNYRMSNLQAALGLAQIKRFNKIKKQKKKIFNFYQKKFERNKFFKLIKEDNNRRFNFWLQTILINKKYSKIIEKTLNHLNKKKIFLRQGWELMPKLKHLKKCPSMKINIAKDVQKRIIHLPSSSFLSKNIFKK